MKTAISIPDDLFNAAEQAAKRLGVSRSELYRKAIRGFLAEHDDDAVTDTLNAIYAADASESEVDAELARIQAASLPRDDW